jgi:hypothetical protein
VITTKRLFNKIDDLFRVREQSEGLPVKKITIKKQDI